MFIPARFPLTFIRPAGRVKDRFNNWIDGPPVEETVKVVSWWVDKTEEGHADSVLRTIDYLHVHVPSHVTVTGDMRVRTPDGAVWEIQGNAENYDHGFHGWSPGVSVVHAKKVEG